MYQIKDVKIDWMVAYGNSPCVNILFDDISDQPDNWEHEAIPNGPGRWVYIAQKYGMVSCHYYDENNHEGYGGKVFTVQMKDGTKHKLAGPWHGGAPNNFLPTTHFCIEVYHTGEKDSSWGGSWGPSIRTYPKTWGYMTYFGLYADIHSLNLWLALNNKPWRIERTETHRYQGWDVKHLKYGFKPEDYRSSYDDRPIQAKWRSQILNDPIERANSHGV
jgi:hypothetical protein